MKFYYQAPKSIYYLFTSQVQLTKYKTDFGYRVANLDQQTYKKKQDKIKLHNQVSKILDILFQESD